MPADDGVYSVRDTGGLTSPLEAIHTVANTRS